MASASPRTVGDFVHRHFMSLAPDCSRGEAEQAMRLARVRALPVVERDRLLGVTELRDLLRARLAEALGLAAEPGPAARPGRASPGVSPDTTLAQAAASLCETGAGFLPVVEGRRLIGLLTESDLLRAILEGEG